MKRFFSPQHGHSQIFAVDQRLFFKATTLNTAEDSVVHHLQLGASLHHSPACGTLVAAGREVLGQLGAGFCFSKKSGEIFADDKN